jgi:hypothetical protein
VSFACPDFAADFVSLPDGIVHRTRRFRGVFTARQTSTQKPGTSASHDFQQKLAKPALQLQFGVVPTIESIGKLQDSTSPFFFFFIPILSFSFSCAIGGFSDCGCAPSVMM